MSDNTTHAEDLLKKLSRRKLLRDSAITATGVALLPSFLAGCRKNVWDYIHDHGGGLGGSDPITHDDLVNAAANLNNLRALMADLYDKTKKYDDVVLEALSSTTSNSNWKNFVADIVIDIAIAMIATAAAATGFGLAIPALAGASAFLHDWGIGKERPDSLAGVNGFFAEYGLAHLTMGIAIDEKLGALTDVNAPANDYKNLLAAWNDPNNPIVFNGKTYTLKDLANSKFPTKEDNDVEYAVLFNAMFLHHQKSVWNLAIMKCCEYYTGYYYENDIMIYNGDTNPASATDYARKTFYPANKGVYARGYYIQNDGNNNRSIGVHYWNLGINGNPFPDAAAAILFKDDTPGNIINEDGLFNRDYVFKQFSITKPRFFLDGYLELGNTANVDFAGDDDWNYTGGLFPQLIKL